MYRMSCPPELPEGASFCTICGGAVTPLAPSDERAVPKQERPAMPGHRPGPLHRRRGIGGLQRSSAIGVMLGEG